MIANSTLLVCLIVFTICWLLESLCGHIYWHGVQVRLAIWRLSNEAYPLE